MINALSDVIKYFYFALYEHRLNSLYQFRVDPSEQIAAWAVLSSIDVDDLTYGQSVTAT